tara:strand:+ start:1019 stop:1249 length:231 start_codon:yes stop_codon:yes gene_type:complete
MGTRFLPATKAVPREMLPDEDKPLIQWAVEESAAAGCTRFVFVTTHEREPLWAISVMHRIIEKCLSRSAKPGNYSF